MSAYTAAHLAHDASVMLVKGDRRGIVCARRLSRTTLVISVRTCSSPSSTIEVPMVSNALRANCTEL